MARDVWEYFEERKAECERYGLYDLIEPTYVEKKDRGSSEGRLNLQLGMTDDAYIKINERVRVQGNSIHRINYAYYLIINGQEYMARDLDSVHGYHGHAVGHERIVAGRITFKRFVELAWEILTQEEELAGAET